MADGRLSLCNSTDPRPGKIAEPSARTCMADDPTIAELIDRLALLRQENAELIEKNKILRADFEKLERCEFLQSSSPKPQK